MELQQRFCIILNSLPVILQYLQAAVCNCPGNCGAPFAGEWIWGREGPRAHFALASLAVAACPRSFRPSSAHRLLPSGAAFSMILRSR